MVLNARLAAELASARGRKSIKATLKKLGGHRRKGERRTSWKQRLEAKFPPIPEVKTRIFPCEGVPEVGRYPAYDCNAKRIITTSLVGNPGTRCRECTVSTVYRRGLSRYEPNVVIAILKKLWAEKKIGRVAKRPIEVPTPQPKKKGRGE